MGVGLSKVLAGMRNCGCSFTTACRVSAEKMRCHDMRLRLRLASHTYSKIGIKGVALGKPWIWMRCKSGCLAKNSSGLSMRYTRMSTSKGVSPWA